jgi:hypothetical protein
VERPRSLAWSPMHLPVSVRLALATCAVSFVAGACSGAASSPPSVKVAGEPVPAGQLSAVAIAVCRAAGEAAGDPVRAGQTFLGEAHDGIHLIARGLEEVDRQAAANVLVTKQAVEADIAGHAEGPRLATDLERLAAATRSGLDRLGLPVPACAQPGPRPSPGNDY